MPKVMTKAMPVPPQIMAILGFLVFLVNLANLTSINKAAKTKFAF